jgi:2-phosphosulfolactate phosphatase
LPPIFINLELVAGDAVKAVQRGDIIIVIDVLRCSSTIIAALSNGAKGVIPTKNLQEARRRYRENPGSLLAGERRGFKPKGFDLGNSPLQFTKEKVKNKLVILTTTSGAKAISLAKNGRWVFIGALLNVEAVAKEALKMAERERREISLLLAGKEGVFSLEDFICAGAVIENLPKENLGLSDAALVAALTFRQAQESLSSIIRQGSHAQYLKSIGLEEDIKFCSQINIFPTVPVLKDGVIVPLEVLDDH